MVPPATPLHGESNSEFELKTIPSGCFHYIAAIIHLSNKYIFSAYQVSSTILEIIGVVMTLQISLEQQRRAVGRLPFLAESQEHNRKEAYGLSPWREESLILRVQPQGRLPVFTFPLHALLTGDLQQVTSYLISGLSFLICEVEVKKISASVDKYQQS